MIEEDAFVNYQLADAVGRPKRLSQSRSASVAAPQTRVDEGSRTDTHFVSASGPTEGQKQSPLEWPVQLHIPGQRGVASRGLAATSPEAQSAPNTLLVFFIRTSPVPPRRAALGGVPSDGLTRRKSFSLVGVEWAIQVVGRSYSAYSVNELSDLSSQGITYGELHSE